jgi:hypothetical protein
MRFNTERPQETGFYFVKYRASTGKQHNTVMRAYCSSKYIKGASNTPNLVFWDGENVRVSDDRLLAFAGPIPLPLENCPSCGDVLNLNGNCSSTHCSREHDSVKS